MFTHRSQLSEETGEPNHKFVSLKVKVLRYLRDKGAGWSEAWGRVIGCRQKVW